jgi:ATP-dependent protease HslVU (ClpYQ) peptidase subunit
MTCIVGIRDRGSVIIGGDSAGVSGYSVTVRADRKVFQNGPYIMGFTTSFRMGQLLHRSLVPPVPPRASDLEGFMVTTFVDAVRECLKEGGYAETKDGAEIGGTFLVGVRGHLFEIGADYQVGIPADGYTAVGCGDDIALGAFYVTRGSSLTAAERASAALRAAAHHSGGVMAPFHLVTTATE